MIESKRVLTVSKSGRVTKVLRKWQRCISATHSEVQCSNGNAFEPPKSERLAEPLKEEKTTNSSSWWLGRRSAVVCREYGLGLSFSIPSWRGWALFLFSSFGGRPSKWFTPRPAHSSVPRSHEWILIDSGVSVFPGSISGIVFDLKWSAFGTCPVDTDRY